MLDSSVDNPSNSSALRRILVAGDHFVTPDLMEASLRREIGGAAPISRISTPFPLEPFRDIAEVREASGSEEQMISALEGIEICVAHHAPLTKRVLAASPSLKLYVVCRGGPVNVNLDAATATGVLVGFTPGRNATAAAEFSVAAALTALRGIPAADRGIRAGGWPGDYTYQTAGFEVEGSVCGVIGYGAIGRRVARILRGFGATVLTYDPYAKIAPEDEVEQVSLDNLIERSRLVSLHVRQTAQSTGMIGRPQIAKMPRGSVLVNCARGGLVDYRALEEALKSGHLFAAAADVFPDEPLPPGSSLRELPNFVLTPHIAGGTRQAAEKAARIASEQVAHYLNGEPLDFCANPQLQQQAHQG